MHRRLIVALALCVPALFAFSAAAQTRYVVKGLVLEVDLPHSRFVVSHEAIPGTMAAMTMPFEVREPTALTGVSAGMLVEFTLVIGADAAYAEGVQIVRYESIEQDPLTARRLTGPIWRC